MIDTDPHKNGFLAVIADGAARLPAGMLVGVGHVADVFEAPYGSDAFGALLDAFCEAAGLAATFEPPDGLRFRPAGPAAPATPAE